MTHLLFTTFLTVALIFGCGLPCSALEQGTPVDDLSLADITMFEYNMNKNDGPVKFELKLPVAIETEGLRGPLSPTDPISKYFWEKYQLNGLQWSINYRPSEVKNYKTPFLRIFGIQSVGTPVKIKLKAPTPEQITLPLSGAGGQAGNVSYKVIKRSLFVKVHKAEGDVDNAKINFVKDGDTLTASWTPGIVPDKYGPELTAPVVLELTLMYRIKREVVFNGKVHDGMSRKGWTKRRVAWLALPVCGMEYGEDDEPIACPLSMDPGPQWKEYTMGPVSIQIPENWESRIKNGNARFELGDKIAGISMGREEGAEALLETMVEKQEKKIKISGLKATEYSGLVRKNKYKARLTLFNETPSDDNPLGVVTILKDDHYADVLQAALDSITIDQGPAPVPKISAGRALPMVAELGDLGKGEYHYTPSGLPAQEFETAEATPPAKTVVPAQASVPVPVENQVPGNTALGSGHLKLKKLKGFGDFAGRNEAFQGDGSPDALMAMEIEAPDQTIVKLKLREKVSKKVHWDTIKGNGHWLVVVTKKNKPVNLTDGSMAYKLGSKKETLNLWVQDNHTLARAKEGIELVIGFQNNETLILPLDR